MILEGHALSQFSYKGVKLEACRWCPNPHVIMDMGRLSILKALGMAIRCANPPLSKKHPVINGYLNCLRVSDM